MYKIKVNGKYNLLIRDIGISVSYINTDGVLLTKEMFDGSSDIKKMIDSNLIIVEEYSEKPQIKPKKSMKKEEKTFVSEGLTISTPEDVFVRKPENKPSQLKIEEVTSKETFEANQKNEVDNQKIENTVEMIGEKKESLKKETKKTLKKDNLVKNDDASNKEKNE
jgi:hypothetical protein